MCEVAGVEIFEDDMMEIKESGSIMESPIRMTETATSRREGQL